MQSFLIQHTLKAQFHNIVKNSTGRDKRGKTKLATPPLMSFERWILNAASHQLKQIKERKKGAQQKLSEEFFSYLIPNVSNYCDQGLVNDLIRHGHCANIA